MLTTKEYMRETTAIDPKWLVEFVAAFFKFSDPTKLSKRKQQEKIEPLYNRLVCVCVCEGREGPERERWKLTRGGREGGRRERKGRTLEVVGEVEIIFLSYHRYEEANAWRISRQKVRK